MQKMWVKIPAGEFSFASFLCLGQPVLIGTSFTGSKHVVRTRCDHPYWAWKLPGINFVPKNKRCSLSRKDLRRTADSQKKRILNSSIRILTLYSNTSLYRLLTQITETQTYKAVGWCHWNFPHRSEERV